MRNFRKSILCSLLIKMAFVVILEAHSPRAFALNLKTQLNSSEPFLDNSQIRNQISGNETTLEDLLIKYGQDQKSSVHSEITPDRNNSKETDSVNRKKEDFSTFATFLVEIIVFFVFLAILLSFISVCARKCGGNPSNSYTGRYGPGPMGHLVHDPEGHEYEPVSGLTHSFGSGFPSAQPTSCGQDYHNPYGHQLSAPRVSVVPSEYSDYQDEDGVERSKLKRKKKKIPGPTF